MMNPKDFQVTPWSHKALNDKSGPSKELVHNATRPDTVAPTSMNHFKPTPHSGTGYKELGHTGNMGIGNPRAMSSDRSEMKPTMNMSKPAQVMKSMPDVPKDHVKWHKSGKYDMSDGAGMGENSAAKINMKMKAR